MTSFPVDLRDGDLTIDGIPMRTPAWIVLDLTRLWGFPELRGGNSRIPRASGTRAKPRRRDETPYTLDILINADCDWEGTPYDDRVSGLIENIEYLWAMVGEPPAAPQATRTAVLDMPDGSTRTDEVQVALRLGIVDPDQAVAVLELTVPAGRFGEAGS